MVTVVSERWLQVEGGSRPALGSSGARADFPSSPDGIFFQREAVAATSQALFRAATSSVVWPDFWGAGCSVSMGTCRLRPPSAPLGLCRSKSKVGAPVPLVSSRPPHLHGAAPPLHQSCVHRSSTFRNFPSRSRLGHLSQEAGLSPVLAFDVPPHAA